MNLHLYDIRIYYAFKKIIQRTWELWHIKSLRTLRRFHPTPNFRDEDSEVHKDVGELFTESGVSVTEG